MTSLLPTLIPFFNLSLHPPPPFSSSHVEPSHSWRISQDKERCRGPKQEEDCSILAIVSHRHVFLCHAKCWFYSQKINCLTTVARSKYTEEDSSLLALFLGSYWKYYG